jgi:hypothetical protein
MFFEDETQREKTGLGENKSITGIDEGWTISLVNRKTVPI